MAAEAPPPAVYAPCGGPDGPPPPQIPAAPATALLLGGVGGTWRAEVQAALRSRGFAVANPENAAYGTLTDEGHRRQCRWEIDWLRSPNSLKIFWFRKDTPGTVSFFELGAALAAAGAGAAAGTASVVVGAEPGFASLRELAHRAALFAPHLRVHSSLDALVDAAAAALQHTPPPQAASEAATTTAVRVPKRGRDYLGVGAGAYVFDKLRRVLLVRRADDSRSEPGTWARPGGAVEMGETVEEALAREMLEEVGVAIRNPVLHDLSTQCGPQAHWVAVGYVAELACGAEEAVNKEPHKHPQAAWFPLHALPSPLAAFVKDSLPKVAAEPDRYLPRLAGEVERAAVAAAEVLHLPAETEGGGGGGEADASLPPAAKRSRTKQ